MMNNKKKVLIVELVILVIIALIVTAIFTVEMNLGIFKVVSPQNLLAQYASINDMNAKLATSKSN